MRNLLTIAIAVAAGSGFVAADDFTKEDLGAGSPRFLSPRAASWAGSAWVFFTPRDTAQVSYVKAQFIDGTLVKEKEQTLASARGFRLGCTFVFRNTLYVVGQSYQTGILGYTTPRDAVSWNAMRMLMPVNPQLGQPLALAAGVLRDTVYLFYTDPAGHISYVSSTDVAHWTAPRPFTLGEWHRTGGNISVCEFQDTTGTAHLMLGWVGALPDLRVNTAWFDGHTFSRQVIHQVQPGETWARANAVTLIAGSASPSPAGETQVQLFYNSLELYHPLKRASYSIKADSWTVYDERLCHLYSQTAWPCAVPLARASGDTVRKEVLCTYFNGFNNRLSALRYVSDLMVIDRKSIITQEMDTTYRALWALVGVVEGPPPYQLNGKEFSSSEPPSRFTFGEEQKTGMKVTHDYELAFAAKVSFGGGGKTSWGGGFSVGDRMALALGFEDESTLTKEIHYEVIPDSARNLGYHIFFRPAITRYRCELRDWAGHATGRYDYAFTVTGGSIHFETFTQDRVNTHDLKSFENRSVSPLGQTICEQQVDWRPTLKSTAQFSREHEHQTTHSLENTLTLTQTLKKGIFKLELEEEFKFTLRATQQTSDKEAVGFEINGPACGAPRAGHPEDVASYVLTGYWLQAEEGKSHYWVPAQYQGCRPWLFTWGVTELKFGGGAAGGQPGEETADRAGFGALAPSVGPDGFTIGYRLAQAGRATIRVFDLGGRVIRTLVDRPEPAGAHALAWDGTDDQGRRVARGVYFLRLTAAGQSATAKVVMLE